MNKHTHAYPKSIAPERAANFGVKHIVIDATGGILGRIASFAAKQSLLGKEVAIVNCKDAIVSGRLRSTIEHYKQLRQRGGDSLRGPHFPKDPQRIMKRTVRGMLSHRQGRGREALKRVMCYDDTPEKFKDAKKMTVVKELHAKSITLAKLESEM